jgi:hypothetical protein
MEPLIIDSIIEKIDASVNRLDEQEKVISEISQKVLVITDQSAAIKNVAEVIKKVQENIGTIRWPVKEMTEMSSRLDTNNELLANPRKTEKIIFHTAGRLLWVVIGLSIGIVFITMGWINTSNKLDQFRMHDIMWRFVKLTNHSQNLEYLHSVETLYLGNSEKMESLVLQGELSQKQFEESDIKSTKDYPTPLKSQIHINAKIKRK